MRAASPTGFKQNHLRLVTFWYDNDDCDLMMTGSRAARGVRFSTGAASSGAEAKGRPQDRAHVGHHQPRALFQVLRRLRIVGYSIVAAV